MLSCFPGSASARLPVQVLSAAGCSVAKASALATIGTRSGLPGWRSALPPAVPIGAATEYREPNSPCSRAGTQRSASRRGQCSPSPVGLSSMSARSSGVAPARPSACAVGNVTSMPGFIRRVTRALCRSYRAEKTCPSSRSSSARDSAWASAVSVTAMDFSPFGADRVQGSVQHLRRRGRRRTRNVAAVGSGQVPCSGCPDPGAWAADAWLLQQANATWFRALSAGAMCPVYRTSGRYGVAIRNFC